MSYDDEIALLAEDIRRWAGPDARIHEALEQMMKLVASEVDALAFEAKELDEALAFEKAKAHPWFSRNERPA